MLRRPGEAREEGRKASRGVFAVEKSCSVSMWSLRVEFASGVCELSLLVGWRRWCIFARLDWLLLKAVGCVRRGFVFCKPGCCVLCSLRGMFQGRRGGGLGVRQGVATFACLAARHAHARTHTNAHRGAEHCYTQE